MRLKVTTQDNYGDLPLPAYMTEKSSGLDALACIDEDITLNPNDVVLVSTGISCEIPEGFEIQVRTRSGMSLKHGLIVLNSPGTIDEDYIGVIRAIIKNTSLTPYTISRGDRICQLVLCPVYRLDWVEVDSLSDTPRGCNGCVIITRLRQHLYALGNHQFAQKQHL